MYICKYMKDFKTKEICIREGLEQVLRDGADEVAGAVGDTAGTEAGAVVGTWGQRVSTRLVQPTGRERLTITAVGTGDVYRALLDRDGGSRGREGKGSDSKELGMHVARRKE